MKNCISIILTAAMTLTLAACTAAPDPTPLATPTPEPTAAPAAPTPAPAAADFYTLKATTAPLMTAPPTMSSRSGSATRCC
mgnify:CR=1 FL=1